MPPPLVGLCARLMVKPSMRVLLATAFNVTLVGGGMALSAILCGQVIRLGVLNKSWTLFGQAMSEYDALILGAGIMVVLLVVTLGLIPSVIRKAQWVPGRT